MGIKKILRWLAYNRKLNWLSDPLYLKVLYYATMGKALDLKNPKTFNEKLQWLKLYDHNPEYTKLVDKYEVKKIIAERIGEQYVIPTLGVWDRFDDIDFDALPDQFVLKCTHDSGGLVICRDKKTLDKEKARRKIETSLKQNYFYSGREWPYKNIKPRIIAEQYMEDTATAELRDYKIFTFDGVAKALFIASDRNSSTEETKFDFFDADFRHLPFTKGHPNAKITPAKPETFDEMLRLAEKLSANIPHLRVDFYEVNGKAYFGELTFFSGSGMTPFDPAEWDETFGSWIKLPENTGGGYLLVTDGLVLWLHEKQPRSGDDAPGGLTDYKFFCFDGAADNVMVVVDRAIRQPKFYHFSKDWKILHYNRLCRTLPDDFTIPKPPQMDEMFALAEKMSAGIPHVRVDFYVVDGQIYFGEYTFFNESGFESGFDDYSDGHLGSLIKLPPKRG